MIERCGADQSAAEDAVADQARQAAQCADAGPSGPAAPQLPTAPAELLRLQGYAGNRAVTGLVQRAVADGDRPLSVQRDGPQLQLPTLDTTLRPPGPESQYQLHLDPQIQAQIRAIEAFHQVLQPARVIAGLDQVALPGLTPGPSGPFPAATPFSAAPTPVPAVPVSPASAAPGSASPMPGAPTENRPGTAADIWNAVKADPTLGPAIQKLQDQVLETVSRDWESLSGGEKAATVATTITIVGTAVAGVLSDPEAREWVASSLRGTIYPVPKVPGLGVQLDLGREGVVLGLRFDVGQVLPAFLGFTPNDTKASGTKP